MFRKPGAAALIAAAPLLILTTIAASPPRAASEPSPREWTIDTSQSKLTIHVEPGGILSPTLHPHHFQPDEWSGEITWDPKNPRTAKVEVRVSAGSLHDKQEKLKPKDIAKVEAQAKGPAILDVAQYPTVTFEAHELDVSKAPVNGKGEFRGTLNGTLTLHGKSGPVGMAIQGLAAPERFEAGASANFKQSDFGIKPYKTALGTISVKDEVNVEISIVALPAGKKPPATPSQ
jgi:polyisoprenoid-binding protein YceI